MMDGTIERFSDAQLAAHRAFLEERVFEIHGKWPQFARLIEDSVEAARTLPAGSTVVSLERTRLYGGLSLFAPFFQDHRFRSIDASPDSAEERGGYNDWVRTDPRCLKVPSNRHAPVSDIGLEPESVDFLIVPNLVHHVRHQEAMFAEIARLLKPGAGGFIFEPLLRELHQIPDDYVRYTPWGFERMLQGAGLAMTRFVPTGGPFTAIAYCWGQALEFFSEPQRSEMTRWFEEEHLPQLRRWDAENPDNQVRHHTSFPTAYSVFFTKP